MIRKIKEDAVHANATGAAIAGTNPDSDPNSDPNSDPTHTLAPKLGYTARKALEDAKRLLTRRRDKRGG